MGFNPEGGGGLALAGLSTAVSLVISTYCIYMHATNYSMPRIQRLIMRILFVCPVYALGSMLSLRFPGASMALETGRDIMEAFVIYSFLCLVLEYAGGDATCVNRIKNEPPLHHPFPFCYLKPIQRDGRFLRICKQGTLQFVIVKPVMAVIALIMISKHKYNTVAYQGFQVLVYNLSYSMALYCLVLFYLGTRVILAQFSPVRKFLAVKSIVFATYWQSLAVRLWVGADEANAWNNFIICVEMVPFSVFLGVAFSHREYIRGIPDSSALRSIKEMFSVRDVVQDAVHNFMPTYQDYVLQRPASPQSNGSGGPAPPKKYRARTFLAGNIDRWQLMDHDQLDHDDHMLEDDVSVDGICTSLTADGGMELGEAGPRTGYSPQRNGRSPPRKGQHRALSSSSTSPPPRFSRGSPATASPEQLSRSGPIGGGARKQPSAASLPGPQPPLQSNGNGQRQRGGSAEGDLISLASPTAPSVTSPPMQGLGSSNPFAANGSPAKKFTTINLETP